MAIRDLADDVHDLPSHHPLPFRGSGLPGRQQALITNNVFEVIIIVQRERISELNKNHVLVVKSGNAV